MDTPAARSCSDKVTRDVSVDNIFLPLSNLSRVLGGLGLCLDLQPLCQQGQSAVAQRHSRRHRDYWTLSTTHLYNPLYDQLCDESPQHFQRERELPWEFRG